jgi:hypothetical protein
MWFSICPECEHVNRVGVITNKNDEETVSMRFGMCGECGVMLGSSCVNEAELESLGLSR